MLRISHLNLAMTEEDLRQLLAPFGPLTMVHLAKDALTRKSRGFAFAQFDNVEDAQTALEQFPQQVGKISWAKRKT